MDGEDIKECIDTAAEVICQNAFSAISLSRASITRRTEQLSQDIQNQLDSRVKTLLHSVSHLKS